MRSLLAVLLLACLPGCVTDPQTGEQEVDWVKLDVLGDEAIAAVDLQMPNWQHRPEVVDAMMNLRKSLVAIDTAVHAIAEGGAPPETLMEYVDTAIHLVNTLLETTDPDDKDLYGTLVTVRSLLGVLRVALA